MPDEFLMSAGERAAFANGKEACQDEIKQLQDQIMDLRKQVIVLTARLERKQQ